VHAFSPWVFTTVGGGADRGRVAAPDVSLGVTLGATPSVEMVWVSIVGGLVTLDGTLRVSVQLDIVGWRLEVDCDRLKARGSLYWRWIKSCECAQEGVLPRPKAPCLYSRFLRVGRVDVQAPGLALWL
jgi:hypothetical protein